MESSCHVLARLKQLQQELSNIDQMTFGIRQLYLLVEMKTLRNLIFVIYKADLLKLQKNRSL